MTGISDDLGQGVHLHSLSHKRVVWFLWYPKKRKVSGKTQERQTAQPPLRQSMSLKCGQCTHMVYAEVKGKKKRRPQVLEYLNKLIYEAKSNKRVG